MKYKIISETVNTIKIVSNKIFIINLYKEEI